MCELMTQHDAAMILGPVERAFGQKYYWRGRSPGERCADDGAGEKSDVASDAGFRARIVKNAFPVCAERPRLTRDVAETNSPKREPRHDKDESCQPQEWKQIGVAIRGTGRGREIDRSSGRHWPARYRWRDGCVFRRARAANQSR